MLTMRQTILVLLPTLLFACGTAKNQKTGDEQSSKNESGKIEFTQGEFRDTRDGYVYSTVIYPNGQTWMADNMLFYKDSSVETIVKHPGTSLPDDVVKMKYMAVKCWDKECKGHTADTYEPAEHGGLGLFYDFDAAKLACPNGWHVATLDDWRKFLKQFEHPKVKLQNGDYLESFILKPEYGLNIQMNMGGERDRNDKLIQYYWATLQVVEAAYPNGDLFKKTTVISIYESGNVIEKEIDIARQYLPCRCVKD